MFKQRKEQHQFMIKSMPTMLQLDRKPKSTTLRDFGLVTYSDFLSRAMYSDFGNFPLDLDEHIGFFAAIPRKLKINAGIVGAVLNRENEVIAIEVYLDGGNPLKEEKIGEIFLPDGILFLVDPENILRIEQTKTRLEEIGLRNQADFDKIVKSRIAPGEKSFTQMNIHDIYDNEGMAIAINLKDPGTYPIFAWKDINGNTARIIITKGKGLCPSKYVDCGLLKCRSNCFLITSPEHALETVD